MEKINTEFLGRCIEVLERSYFLLLETPKDTIDYEIFRNSTIKAFEMTLEKSGKLLRKKLKSYFATPKEVDQLTFKDLFRHASKHGILSQEEIVRWFQYRDNRNNTAHDYGQSFAEETLLLIEKFIQDVKKLKDVIAL